MHATITTMRRGRRRPSRAIATALLIGSLAPATASAQSAPSPMPVALDALCTELPPELRPFRDIEPSSTFRDAIRCQAHAGVTLGVAAHTYGPQQSVTRAQMASFVARTIDTAVTLDRPGGVDLEPLPAPGSGSPFDDVPDESEHAANVSRLADAGIVLGGPGHLPTSSYGPRLPVTRGQMASFVVRAIEHLTGEAPDATADRFADDQTSVHEEAIDAVAEIGIAVGTASGRFEPGVALRRDQMAAFTMRTLAHLEQRELIGPLAAGEPVAYEPCTNDEGFTISYPSTWHTEETCSYFHPHPFEVPELGTDEVIAAIDAGVDLVPSTPEGTPLARNIVTTELVIDGRPAVRHEYESEGGLYADGTPITRYGVDLGEVDGQEKILGLGTIGVDRFDFRVDYEENQAVLDKMAATIDILDD